MSRKLISAAKLKKFTCIEELISDIPRLSGLVESLTPAMFYFDMIEEFKAAGEDQQHEIQIKHLDAGWGAMFDRHAEEVSTIAEIIHLSESDGFRRGQNFWEHELSDRSRLLRFLKSMDEHSTASAIKFGPLLTECSGKSIVDIGCGAGTYARKFIETTEFSRVFLLDKPEVVEQIPLFISLSYLSRIELIPGDVFEVPIPAEQDIYLVSHFLQDFRKEDRLIFLAKLASVLGSSSEVWVHGHHWTPGDVNETVSSFSYYLQVRLGGSLQGRASIETEFSTFGLQLIKTIHTSLTESVLVFRRFA